MTRLPKLSFSNSKSLLAVCGAALLAGCATYPNTYAGVDPVYSERDEYYDDGPFDGPDLDRKGIGDPNEYEDVPGAVARRGYPAGAPYARTAGYRDRVVVDDGIEGGRVAHRRYTDYRAEQLDGQCERVVTVRRGDTLSDIAEYCDVPVRALLEVNGWTNPRTLRVGQRLRVPNVRGEVYEGAAFRTPYRAPYREERVVERVVERPVIVEREVPVERRSNVRYEPAVTLAPREPRLGQEVRIHIDDLPPNADIVLMLGADRGSLRELQRARTDASGRYTSRIRFDGGYSHDRAIIGVRAPSHDIVTYTDPVRVIRDGYYR